MNQANRIRKFHRRQKYGPFIPLLYNILNSGQQTGLIWRPDKKGLSITNYNILIDKTLPNNFDHRDLNYFIRQLKNYQFQQRTDQRPHLSFWAHHFDKDHPNLKVPTLRKITKLMNDRQNGINGINNVNVERREESSSFDQQRPQNNLQQINNLQVNPQNQNMKIQDEQIPLNNFRRTSVVNLVHDLADLQVEYDMLNAEVQYLKDSKVRQHIDPKDVLLSDNSTNFKYFYFQKMQNYKLKQLNMLMNHINTSQSRKLPFEEYFDAYRQIHPFSSIDYRKVTKEIKECQWDCHFSQNALELEHSGNKVDFNQFFKFDWKDFEIVRFENCDLKTIDWVKLCNQVRQNLPNLKQLYIKDNNIQIVKKSDFEQFTKLKKAQLVGNKLNPLCEAEIEEFSKRNSSIIIERD